VCNHRLYTVVHIRSPLALVESPRRCGNKIPRALHEGGPGVKTRFDACFTAVFTRGYRVALCLFLEFAPTARRILFGSPPFLPPHPRSPLFGTNSDTMPPKKQILKCPGPCGSTFTDQVHLDRHVASCCPQEQPLPPPTSPPARGWVANPSAVSSLTGPGSSAAPLTLTPAVVMVSSLTACPLCTVTFPAGISEDHVRTHIGLHYMSDQTLAWALAHIAPNPTAGHSSFVAVPCPGSSRPPSSPPTSRGSSNPSHRSSVDRSPRHARGLVKHKRGDRQGCSGSGR